MKGDNLQITDYHRNAAKDVFVHLKEKGYLFKPFKSVFSITISGESGSGKSEIAVVLSDLLVEDGFVTIILQQDDYFIYPPKTNHNNRVKDIKWVGIKEVRLDLIDQHISAIKQKKKQKLTKPLVIYDEDKIDEEEIDIKDKNIIISEGTYTSLLKFSDFRIFINRTYHQTKKSRLKRARDPAVGFIEQVLEIEHKIINQHIKKADFVIGTPEGEIEK